MMREKTSGIKLHLGADASDLPHMTMVTTANVTDRTGALDMTEYYYDETENLSKIKKFVLATTIHRCLSCQKQENLTVYWARLSMETKTAA